MTLVDAAGLDLDNLTGDQVMLLANILVSRAAACAARQRGRPGCCCSCVDCWQLHWLLAPPPCPRPHHLFTAGLPRDWRRGGLLC